jgi:hypothetical protein
MTILFAMMHPGYMRYYYGALRALAQRGHRIVLAFDIPEKQAKDRLELRLEEEFPSLVTRVAAPRQTDEWEGLGRALAWGMDYLRYFAPTHRDASRLRLRVEVVMHPAFTNLAGALPGWGVRLTSRALQVAYDAVPVSGEYTRWMASHDPDLVLVTPLITQGASFQSEYVRAAKALGLPVGYCVASWDNLTTKGLIRGHPDRVILWNDVQAREAATMHRTPQASVVKTGAQLFDDWFAQRPTTAREDFCRQVGLRPDRPFVLYMCSSNFMAPNEPPFTLRWLQALRQSDNPFLSGLGVLVRPYPEHFAPWTRVNPSAFENFAIWPRDGSYPLTTDTRAHFFDSVHHSAAVVGVNTSALIETAIIGRPALTVLAPEFKASQQGTLHFHYLLKKNGGFLDVASTLDEHLTQLSDVLAHEDAVRRQVADFVHRFVRPFGLDRPATPIWVEAVEALGRAKRRPAARATLVARLLRPGLRLAATRVTAVRGSDAWQAQAELWKAASRRAEEVGGDPLEVWASLSGRANRPTGKGLARLVAGAATARVRRGWRRGLGRLRKQVARWQKRRRRAVTRG